MPQFCLVPQQAEKFKQDIISGKIKPEILAEMTSMERHAFFAKELGESNAAPVNSLFESKLLLKNQQQGYVNWAKRVLNTNPTVQKNIIAKIQRLDKVLNPSEEKAFLEDLAASKLGTHITFEEAQKITELSKKVQETKGVGDRMDYGRAAVELQNYVADLKGNANRFSFAELKTNPGKAVAQGLTELAGQSKAINASMDNSAIFRQGWKVLMTNPKIWMDNAIQSFANIIKTFGKNKVMDELQADIVSRPNYNLMKKAKLDVGVTEEAYPTTLPEKIPVVGKIYKASENAYTAFVQKTRADVFDKYIEIAKATNVELTDEELKSIGKLVNALTGRGGLGPAEPLAKYVNNVLFSPRNFMSQIYTLTHAITGAGGSNFVRKQAALNLLKIITGTAAILVTAKALKHDSVEFDSRSSDFGKIKIGDTRFDVTGGMGSLVVLATRFAKSSTKSSTTGKITKLNAFDKNGKPVYGGQTVGGVIEDFIANKLSPAARVVYEMKIKGSTFEGKKPTIAGEALSLVTPLPVKTGVELWKDPNSANDLLGLIADALGISTNTYAPAPKKK